MAFVRHLVVLPTATLFCTGLKAAPIFTADQTTIVLPPGKTPAPFTMVVNGAGLPAGVPRELEVKDLGSGSPKITYTAQVVDCGTDTALWRITGTVSDMPANSTQTRRLLVKMRGASGSIPFTLKNTPAGDFTWAVEGLASDSKRLWTTKDTIGLHVQVGPVAASNVHLVEPDLISADGEVLQPAFKLCVANGACDGDSDGKDSTKTLSLSANSSQLLELKPKDQSADIGQYSGKLLLVSDQDPLGKTLPLTLIVGNDTWKLAGFVLLAIGTLFSLLLNQFLRANIVRAQARRPAALMRQQVAALQDDIAALETQTGTQMPHAVGLVARAAEKLDETELQNQGFIPPRLPVYYSPTTAGPSKESYQDRLTSVGKALNSIAYVLNDGVREILADPAAGNHKAVVETAIEDFDELLTSAVEPSPQLFESVKKIVEAFKVAVIKLRSINDEDAPLLRFGRRELSVRQLDDQLFELNLIGWISFAVLSVLVGFIVLIAPKPAFGSWQDLVLCALWGFGMPAAGQQLSALSPSSAATSLGVNLLR